MDDPGGVLIQFLFTLLVFGAIVAIVTNTYAEVVLAATLLAILWQLVGFFGPSLWLATVLIGCFTVFWLVVSVAAAIFGADEITPQLLAGVLDAYLTDDRPGSDDREHRLWQPGANRTESEETNHDQRR